MSSRILKKSVMIPLLKDHNKPERENETTGSNDSLDIVLNIGDEPVFEKEFMQFKASVKKTDYDDPAIFDTVEHIQNQINEAGLKTLISYILINF